MYGAGINEIVHSRIELLSEIVFHCSAQHPRGEYSMQLLRVVAKPRALFPFASHPLVKAQREMINTRAARPFSLWIASHAELKANRFVNNVRLEFLVWCFSLAFLQKINQKIFVVNGKFYFNLLKAISIWVRGRFWDTNYCSFCWLLNIWLKVWPVLNDVRGVKNYESWLNLKLVFEPELSIREKI